MDCSYYIIGLCLQEPSASADSMVFGFGEFIPAIALLFVVYTVTDIRYRFRIAVAPGRFFLTSYVLLAFVGVSVLLTEVWLREQWLFPASMLSAAIWQGILAVLFLVLPLVWIYTAFIRPPIFSKRNYKKFYQVLYEIVAKGSESEIPVIASELSRSASAVIDLTDKGFTETEPEHVVYARGVLSLITNRKFCRYIVSSSPMTAVLVFSRMSETGLYPTEAGVFGRNLTTEALINRDSILFHESQGFEAGVIGEHRRFSKALYGNYSMMEHLCRSGYSSLDVDHRWVLKWDAEQLEVYCQCVCVLFANYLKVKTTERDPFVFEQAVSRIRSATFDLYRLNGKSSHILDTDTEDRLRVTLDFITDVIEVIAEQPTTLRVDKLRRRKGDGIAARDIHDVIASLYVKIVEDSCDVKEPIGYAWRIHDNIVWAPVFDMLSDSHREAGSVIHFKIRRLLYDKIRKLETIPTPLRAAVLGFLLNVLSFEETGNRDIGRPYVALQKVVLKWTKLNYLRLKEEYPAIADACLIGRISFDEENDRLVKTFARGLDGNRDKSYLELRKPN